MSQMGQTRRLSCLGMSASPPTPDVPCEATNRRFGPNCRHAAELQLTVRRGKYTRNRATLAGMEASATIMETKMAEDVSSTIAALEDERHTAMLSGDAAKLDRLLDDRLRHVHSSSHVDNKASWMSTFGRLWQYRSIERQDQTIVPLGDSALVFNTLHIDVQVADVLRKVDARALVVWNKSGGAWRVVAVFLATIPMASHSAPQRR
jgi:hypothetical protein